MTTNSILQNRFLRSAFWPGVFLLVAPGVARTYLLMPFPGSQDLETIGVAYLLERLLPFTRTIGILLMIVPLINRFRSGSMTKRIVTVMICLLSVTVVYVSGFYFTAEEIFKEPSSKIFLPARENRVGLERLVIGVEYQGTAKAYPVNYLGYHHKIQDTVGGMAVLVTYCTMCRTGRVFSPIIEGQHEQFRLVGARHYNAVIEDRTTRSWWYQATGEAAAGPLKGQRLSDLPYVQVTLKSWLEQYPSSLILQPDQTFASEYADLNEYDRTIRAVKDSSGRIPLWQRKSWILGIDHIDGARAYDWSCLVRKRLVNDRVGSTPVVIVVESDTLSYHVWSRTVGGKELEFAIDSITGYPIDINSHSSWNWLGESIDGVMKGSRLEHIQAHQEYWHSWQRFHPATTRWLEPDTSILSGQ